MAFSDPQADFGCILGLNGLGQCVWTPDSEQRQAIVVDAAITSKAPWLIGDLVASELLPATPGPGSNDGYPEADATIPLVIATHPHRDHILGMQGLLHSFRHRITEFWDPGYYLPTASYLEAMNEVERNPRLFYSQPATG
jgi:glyoxylase-like metal-dependent hydrolase (beta-lactamase superfamily II)